MRTTRRSALKTLGAAAAAPAIAPAATMAGQPAAPDADVVQSIADAVLPDAIGAEGRRQVAADFLRWLREYREGADTDHGYGVTRLRKTGTSPAVRYPAQIAALDAAAAGLLPGATRFADLSVDQRRTAIAAALRDAGIERLPGRPSGAHLASDLMAFFFNSSQAADLCYEAEIGRDRCRGLEGSEAAPKRRKLQVR